MSRVSGLLRVLRSLKDDYIDEIPAEEVHGKLRYKCQVNWFQIFGSNMMASIDDGTIRDPAIVRSYHRLASVLEESGLGKRLTTETDIRRVNNFLEKIIAYCEQAIDHPRKR